MQVIPFEELSEFGKFSRGLRMKLGIMSAMEMAKQLGISTARLTQAELGTTRTPLWFMRRFIEVYDLTPQEKYDLRRAIMIEGRERIDFIRLSEAERLDILDYVLDVFEEGAKHGK